MTWFAETTRDETRITTRRIFLGGERAEKFVAKAGKFLTGVEKVLAEFVASLFENSLHSRRFDVNTSLHVKPCSMFDGAPRDPDFARSPSRQADRVAYQLSLRAFQHSRNTF